MQFTTSEIIVLLFCAITLIVSVVTLITVLKKNNNNRTENELQRILLNQQSFAQSQNDRAIQLDFTAFQPTMFRALKISDARLMKSLKV